LLQTIGKRGKELGDFNLPLQAATGPDGTVYVVDGGNFRVQSFYPDGTFKEQFGGIGTRSGQFSRPKGIATGPDGNIYVVDTGFANFQIFNVKGELLTYVGQKGRQGVPGEFLLPAGIDVDEDGRVYLVDQFFRKVDVFRPTNMKYSDGWLSSRRKEKGK
jgi:DNA-binding beta-propeller fold protein YncE